MYKRFSFLFLFSFAITIHVFSHQDSLFDNWNNRLDALDLSNIDLLPIYRFTLNEVRNEMKQYENADKQKQSELDWKINYISNILEQRLLHIDSLFFAKALQFEHQGNEQDAVFYYKRSLDFNPSHCLSAERLSYIYAKNDQYPQHIELLYFLILDNRLKYCSLQLFDFAFDSLITKSNRLIEQHNYYDALLILDTLKQFLHYFPHEKHLRTYPILLELAQNGIYTSYYEIINKSLKINKLSLSKEYIYGLFLLIEKNNQQPNQNFFFSGSVQNLIFAHRSNADMDIQRKRYDRAIETTDSMLLFLNSINYLYADNLFFSIYSAAYTEQYANMLKSGNPLADEFYQKHNSYIIYTSANHKKPILKDSLFVEIKEDNTDFSTDNSLYDRINEYVFRSADFSIVDSFFVWQSFFKSISTENISTKDSLAELTMKYLMLKALSKTNQYAWSNELLSAAHLLEKIDSVFIRFALQEDTILAEKNAETTDLVEERIKKYAYEEVQQRLANAKKMIEQKQYYAAYLLLTRNNPIVERSIYRIDTEPLTKKITLPALFQKEEQNAKDLLEMDFFEEGFEKYNQVYAYFQENSLSQYGLECDDLQNFVEKSNREKYFQQLVFYYIKKGLCEEVLNRLFHTVNKYMSDKQWLSEVGNEMKKTTHCNEMIKKQHFTKEYKPFLDAYFGKNKSWWYLVREKLRIKN